MKFRNVKYKVNQRTFYQIFCLDLILVKYGAGMFPKSSVIYMVCQFTKGLHWLLSSEDSVLESTRIPMFSHKLFHLWLVSHAVTPSTEWCKGAVEARRWMVEAA